MVRSPLALTLTLALALTLTLTQAFVRTSASDDASPSGVLTSGYRAAPPPLQRLQRRLQRRLQSGGASSVQRLQRRLQSWRRPPRRKALPSGHERQDQP